MVETPTLLQTCLSTCWLTSLRVWAAHYFLTLLNCNQDSDLRFIMDWAPHLRYFTFKWEVGSTMAFPSILFMTEYPTRSLDSWNVYFGVAFYFSPLAHSEAECRIDQMGLSHNEVSCSGLLRRDSEGFTIRWMEYLFE